MLSRWGSMKKRQMEPGALEYFLPLVITWKIVNHLTRWGEKKREKQNILFYMCQTSEKGKMHVLYWLLLHRCAKSKWR